MYLIHQEIFDLGRKTHTANNLSMLFIYIFSKIPYEHQGFWAWDHHLYQTVGKLRKKYQDNIASL